jgi:hypothetical protein
MSSFHIGLILTSIAYSSVLLVAQLCYIQSSVLVSDVSGSQNAMKISP